MLRIVVQFLVSGCRPLGLSAWGVARILLLVCGGLVVARAVGPHFFASGCRDASKAPNRLVLRLLQSSHQGVTLPDGRGGFARKDFSERTAEGSSVSTRPDPRSAWRPGLQGLAV